VKSFDAGNLKSALHLLGSEAMGQKKNREALSGGVGGRGGCT